MKLFMRIAWFLVVLVSLVVGFCGVVVTVNLVFACFDHGLWYLVVGPIFCVAAWILSGEWIKDCERKRVGK